jgi:hypothetical protein
MTTLELRVSQAQTRLNALERAMHSRAGWELAIGARRVAVQPVVHEHGIYFEAYFGSVPERAVLTLMHEGHGLLATPFVPPRDFDGWVTWDLAVEEPVAA